MNSGNVQEKVEVLIYIKNNLEINRVINIIMILYY